jgi:predicted O-methyltransferase YrrM
VIHFHHNIDWPHFDFADLYARVVAEAPPDATLVEVGCWLGRSMAFLAVEAANSGKALHLVAVDTWQGSIGEPGMQAYARENDVYAMFRRNLAPVIDRISVLRLESVKAASYLDDGTLHFVFIDASHDEASVAADIAAWWPKVAVGGLLAGHDYNTDHRGVCDAVGAAFPEGVEAVGGCWVKRKSR